MKKQVGASSIVAAIVGLIICVSCYYVLRHRPFVRAAIGKVRTGMTSKEVEVLVGKPTFIGDGPIHGGPASETWHWCQLPVGNSIAQVVIGDDGRVMSVATSP